MGGSKGGSVTVGYRYYMTLQIGIGRGPVDSIEEIRIGDKMAWPFREGETANYDSPITDDRETAIRAGNLFGGDKSEGGVEGSLTAMMGKPTQFYPAWFKNLLGPDVPDFRGVATLIFDGLICALNPYPKEWKIRTRRTVSGWDGEVWRPELAVIWLANASIKAMNPAHIVYEAVTNRAWGRGYDRSRINDAVWTQTAQTLYDEGFGLCIAWKRQSTLQEFVEQILSHIGGTLYTDRETGLLNLKLIRDDYDPDEIPLFTYDTGLLSVEEPETASMADATSEIIVKYTDVLANEEKEVRAQNLAVLQSAEGFNSKTNTYMGIPTLDLAARVAQRDLRAQSASASRYVVKLDRRAWRMYPGAVFRISAPHEGIDNLVLRAGKVDGGSLTDGTITAEAVLDVFGLSAAAFVQAETPAWQPPDPTPFPITERRVREATYRELAAQTSPADLALVEPTAAALATIALRPSPTTLGYSIATQTGGEEFVVRNAESFAASAILNGAVSYYTTTFPFRAGRDIGLLYVGSVAEIENEMVRVDSIDLATDGISGSITVTRGIGDTIPVPHANGARLFFLIDAIGTDNREYAMGEQVNVKLLSNTSSAVLDPSLAPTDTVLMTARQGRPYPPGNVRVNNIPCFNNPAVSSAFTVTWAHRDRKLQVDQIVGHDEGNVGPEAGTSYRLRFYSQATGVMLASYNNITGNSISISDPDIEGVVRVTLETSRGGIFSQQSYSFLIQAS